jgi:hypothetical protein
VDKKLQQLIRLKSERQNIDLWYHEEWCNDKWCNLAKVLSKYILKTNNAMQRINTVNCKFITTG